MIAALLVAVMVKCCVPGWNARKLAVVPLVMLGGAGDGITCARKPWLLPSVYGKLVPTHDIHPAPVWALTPVVASARQMTAFVAGLASVMITFEVLPIRPTVYGWPVVSRMWSVVVMLSTSWPFWVEVCTNQPPCVVTFQTT